MSPQSTGTQSSSLSSAAPARYQDHLQSNHLPLSLSELARLLQPQQQSYQNQPSVSNNGPSLGLPSQPSQLPHNNPPYSMQNVHNTHFSVGVTFPAAADPTGPSALPMNPSLFWPNLMPQATRSNWQTPLPGKADTSLGPSGFAGFSGFPNVNSLPNNSAPLGGSPENNGPQPSLGTDLPYLSSDYLNETPALNNASRAPSAPSQMPTPSMNYGSSFGQLSNGSFENLDQVAALVSQLANHQPQDVPSVGSVSLTVSWPQSQMPNPINSITSDLHNPSNLTLPQLHSFFVPPTSGNYGSGLLPNPILPSYPTPSVGTALGPYFPPLQGPPSSSPSSSSSTGSSLIDSKPGNALVKPQKPRRPSRPKRPKRERGGQPFESTVVCGVLDPSVPVDAPDSEVKASGDIEQYSEFFGFKVRIFMAVRDPTRQTLYQSSDLVRRLGLRHTYLAMHLKRKKTASKGIWQAANVLFKRQSDKGIKSGSYFLSEEACREFKQYYENKKLSQDDESAHSSPSN